MIRQSNLDAFGNAIVSSNDYKRLAMSGVDWEIFTVRCRCEGGTRASKLFFDCSAQCLI